MIMQYLEQKLTAKQHFGKMTKVLSYEKTTEMKTAQHTKDLKKNYRGDSNARHRHNDRL